MANKEKYPGCLGFPSIYQNGDRAQDLTNWAMNRMSVDNYLFRLMDIAISVYKWENLPKGIDERMLEFWLLRDGFCIFFYDKDLKAGTNEKAAPEGYAVLQGMISGDWDIYNYPTQRRAYATNGFNAELTEENSVIIFNDYLRVPMLPTINLYAARLGEIDRTIDVNVMNQKTPKIIRCDEKQRLTFKNIAMQVDGNYYWIFGDKNIDMKAIDILDISAPYVANDLQILKSQLWNEALTFLGIENVNTTKKERLVTSEVMYNMGDVEAQRYTRLNARQQACEKINDMLESMGWFENPDHKPVTCHFRNELMEDNPEEMSEEEVELYTGESVEDWEEIPEKVTMWERLKRALGGGVNE